MSAGCIKLTAKKYKSRPSPPFSAQDCKGKTLKGNDGKMYVSNPDKRGVHKWILQKPKTLKVKGKEYEIIDNYNRPFIAVVGSGKVTIYSTKHTDSKPIQYLKDKEILSTSHLKVFIGDNDLKDNHYAKKGMFPGNSILIKVSPQKYIYVGDQIYSFKTDDPITSYYSPLGNNQVPYPYAVGEKSVYFMLDRIAVPVEQIDLKEDGYGQYYMKEGELKKTPFKVTIIKRRQV